MAGFRGGDGDAHGFGVAHFADDDDVGRLAQGAAKRGGKIRRVDADFHLLDDAAHVLMLVLDRIFDDDDVARFAAVDVVDQGGHGRGLAGAGGAADEHQATLQMGQGFDRRGKVQLLQGRHAGREDANRSGGAALLAVKIDAKTAETYDAIGRVGNVGFAIEDQRVARKCGKNGRFDFRPIEDARLDFANFAMHAHAGRRAGDEEQIAGAAANQHGQPAVETLGGGGIDFRDSCSRSRWFSLAASSIQAPAGC